MISGKIKTYWHKLTHIGVHDGLDMREARRVSYINYITLFSMAYLEIRSILNISNLPYFCGLLVINVPAVLILIFNYYRLYTLAKITLFTGFVTATSIFSYTYLGGFKYGSFMLLFAAVPWPYMLFDIKQIALTYASLGYLLFCFLAVIILQFVRPLQVSDGVDIEVVRISVTVLTIFFLLLLTRYFCSTNAAAEEVLLQEKEKAESANRAKSSFLANMSHELRTPLNAILGFSELMQRDPGITQEQRANLETIGRSGAHLLSLINDVLEFSKIEAGRNELHPENFDLQNLLLTLKEMFQLPVQQKGLLLDFEQDDNVPQTIFADQNKLRQILINILGNAIKFTEKGGITLSLEFMENGPGEGFLRFVVIDTGTGISEAEQEKVFDAFFQSESLQSSHHGTGLGLPISRNFAELMGGDLTVESTLASGTQFTLNIPVKCADHIKTKRGHERKFMALAPEQPLYRLLVVEDNESNRSLLASLLRNIGFEVQEAANGREAIEQWRKWQPHLIWMDIRMPEMNGYEAINIIKSEMKANRADVDTKIIALTASAFEEDRLKVLESGGDDFVRKPFQEGVIFNMLKKHLRVKYIYQGDDETLHSHVAQGKLADERLKNLMAELSDDYLMRLKEATELSDTNRIEQAIEDIQGQNSELAAILAGLAENFAYDEILALVAKN